MGLYEKHYYTADISYLTNVFIYEYDISKCNINVLFTKGAIDKKTYDYLYRSPRMVRQVYVGNLIKNPELSKILSDGITEYKQKFFEVNSIRDGDVLAIKNDAIFLIIKKVQYTKFGLIEFVKKNVYTAYYKLNGLEIYYYYSNVTKEEYVDIKGINDKKVELHKGFFLQVLQDLFYSIQVNGPVISMQMLKEVYTEYVTLQMPVECYRTFNADSIYHFNVFSKSTMAGYQINGITDAYKPMLDISTNLKVLMELQRIIVTMYFSK